MRLAVWLLGTEVLCVQLGGGPEAGVEDDPGEALSGGDTGSRAVESAGGTGMGFTVPAAEHDPWDYGEDRKRRA